ncbi:LamG-like jellyroll fold domain-containing protein [Sedimentisphaera salicampi]|uniref:Immunoglobulin I-set domain protein n=1 Tax=Sedimentisphaera salicampi TaxID=1941349 RepID=A0A1W6LIZ6_9BACT|nr:LamG-like jellyroll fold domain-containing protein [Sedimentisphaera salicampi]ARN55757.1 Immunoglobulin I-set domain protein [Sedimentisphaera salicampi]
MTKIYKILVLMLCLAAFSAAFAGEIVPGFDDSAALVDYAERQVQNNDDMPAIQGSGLMTLAAKFTPTEADVTKTDGPVIVIEVGGTTFGTGVYICNGMLTFCSKGANGSGGLGVTIADLNDTDASDSAFAVAMGPVYAGVETRAFASFNTNTGELVVMINGRLYEETISGTVGTANLTGSKTVSVLNQVPGPGEDYDYGNMGGLSGGDSHILVTSNDSAVAMETESGSAVRGQIFEDVVDLETLPRNPLPANNAENIDPVAVTSVQFDTAGDPANTSNPNPNVTGHFVTIYSTFDPTNPANNVAAVDTFVAAGSDPVQVPYSFNLGDEVFWQVEEQVGGASKGDPANILGPIWEFKALPAIPAITASPQDAADFPGSEISFSAAFTSKSSANVQWVKAGDPEIILDESDPDITISGSQHGDSYTSGLTVSNIEKADQGEYFCRATNADGIADSDYARLGVKRMIGYWPLDGDYLDYSGDEHHADPNTAPLATQWVDGVDPAVTGQALDTEPNALVAASTEPFEPAKYTDELSITLWVKWSGEPNPDQYYGGLVCSHGQNTTENGNNWFFELTNDGQPYANAPGYNGWGVPDVHYLAPDQWAQVAFVNEAGETGKLFVNGALVAVDETHQITKAENPVYLMCSNIDSAGTLIQTTVGVFDEIKMYNYALTTDEIAQQYYDITGETFCKDPYSDALMYDFDGNCRVDLADFAIFALDWQESNLYPKVE